jgi:hypothetical protein
VILIRILYRKTTKKNKQKGEQIMKNYESPRLKEEKVNLEDICAVSNVGQGNDGNTDSSSLADLFGNK